MLGPPFCLTDEEAADADRADGRRRPLRLVSGDVALVRCPRPGSTTTDPGHPLRPDRVLLTWDLIEAVGLDRRPGVARIGCEPASDDVLGLVHTPSSSRPRRPPGAAWRGTGPGSATGRATTRSSTGCTRPALVAGASVAAAGRCGAATLHAFNAAGGLHHAMPARASLLRLRRPGGRDRVAAPRGRGAVAYVDVDVHHGDGVQAIFWDDPRGADDLDPPVRPGWFFPGTGDASERGGPGPRGRRSTCRSPGHGRRRVARGVPRRDRAGRRAVRSRRARDAARCDTHVSDPLANLRLTTERTARVRGAPRARHRAAAGRWIATGGGGYQWARVVPRAWTLAFAAMVDALDELPGRPARGFIEEAERRSAARCRRRSPSPMSGPGRRTTGRGRRGRGRQRGARPMTSRTKLVCTLGPASATPKMIQGLVEAGAGLRINCSHGTEEEHARVRVARPRCGGSRPPRARRPRRPPRPQGAPLAVDPDPLTIRQGQFELGPRARATNAAPHDVSGPRRRPPRGDRVLLADGAVELTVVGTRDGVVATECVRAGTCAAIRA